MPKKPADPSKPTTATAERKRAMFALAYVGCLNATQAAIAAGYSARSAGSHGSLLMKDPRVIALIKEETEARLLPLRAAANRVIEEAASIAFSNIEDIGPWDAGGYHRIKASKDIGEFQKRAIKKIKSTKTITANPDGSQKVEYVSEVELHDKRGGLKILADLLGLKAPENLSVNLTGGLGDLISNLGRLPPPPKPSEADDD